jgi:peptidoglycan/LPS O-acetylase OafA/YrhL
MALLPDLNHLNPYSRSVESGRIPSLDGLRGVAIIMVILAHGAYALPESALLQPLQNGHLGVNIFFVLSGYLIYNLSQRELLKTGRFDWRHFYL